MGVVYEAEHILLHRKVAVKVMHENFTQKPGAVERFFREAQAASSLGHPNIIDVQDFGKEEDGTIYMVMELLKGDNLDDLLQKRGNLPPGRVAGIVLQTLSALSVAHNRGIIHRDLKPDNIFLAVDALGREEVKLLDFGVAKFADAGDDKLGLTKTGTVLGTPYYLAPEQAKGGKGIDARIDIWSVGVMMYEMLTGRMPFEGDNYNEILGKILLEEPTSLAEVAPHVPKALVAIVERALMKDRDQRYDNVVQMIEEMMPFRNHKGVPMSTPAETALQNSVIPPPFGGGPLLPEEGVPPKGSTEQPSISQEIIARGRTNTPVVNPIPEAQAIAGVQLTPETPGETDLDNAKTKSLPAESIEEIPVTVTGSFTQSLAPEDLIPLDDRPSWRKPRTIASFAIVFIALIGILVLLAIHLGPAYHWFITYLSYSAMHVYGSSTCGRHSTIKPRVMSAIWR